MSFLADYRDYASGNEAHPTYHHFSALVCLSSIISRRVWIDLGYFKVFPNLYVVLVGPAGNRKTTAMSIAKGLLHELKVVPLSAECVTKEKLVLDINDQARLIEGLPKEFDKLRTYSPMTCMVTELSEFLGAGGIGMINFLTTIYDQDYYELRTKNKGSVIVPGPYLNVLACTTPSWMSMYLKTDVISGGFSRRTLFVFETTDSGRVPFPEVTPAMLASRNKLILHALQLFKVSGPFTWDPDARSFYEDWYRNARFPEDEVLAGYYKSKHIQMLKIAMLIALSESTDLIMRRAHLEFALDTLKLIESNLDRVFDGMGRNELAGVARKILDIYATLPVTVTKDGKRIRAYPEKALRARMFRDAEALELVQVIQHLVESEKLHRIMVGTQAMLIQHVTTD